MISSAYKNRITDIHYAKHPELQSFAFKTILSMKMANNIYFDRGSETVLYVRYVSGYSLYCTLATCLADYRVGGHRAILDDTDNDDECRTLCLCFFHLKNDILVSINGVKVLSSKQAARLIKQSPDR
jgi:hypothetical protein